VSAIRSEKESICIGGFFSYKAMAATIIFTFGLQMATIYVPALNPIFNTELLSLEALLRCLAISSVGFFAVEAEKWLVRRGLLYRASTR